MNTLSINLIVEEKSCLVVGAGQVALRKIENLLLKRALVTVIAPKAIKQIINLSQQKKIVLLERAFQKTDVRQFFLVIAATNKNAVNKLIYEEAQAAGILVNVVDDPPHCSFYFPAEILKGDLQFALSSGGSIPFAIKRFRILIDALLNSPDWHAWLNQARILRNKILQSNIPEENRNCIYDDFFSQSVQSSGLIEVQKLPDSSFQALINELDV
ncbi:bifunctional precorrin-2 dehydrogenase/sirohydrochlorin ferrochelatase [candidate division CSSED10-310 bacterium]|uniref:precorrin-2 dehydrogenase n=1 Tax=candidate division CSSED10-310 bacterium TaxID=2855610 RepID=A0ABV6Z4S0_UNCC1